MKEYLLDEDLDYRQAKLLDEADSFDLEDFYHSKGASTGAVCLITKNQMLMTDCYSKPNPESRYGLHYDTANEMYIAIYGKQLDFNGWEKQIERDGNILIRLSTLSSTIVYLPEKITNTQAELFNNFIKRMNIILKSDTQYFEKNPIEVIYWDEINKVLESDINSFETILEIAQEKTEVEYGKKIH